jgi:hypothetical protein
MSGSLEQQVADAVPAGVRMDTDVPQGCEIVASFQHVHAWRPVGQDCPAEALGALLRVRGDNRPVRQVPLLGPARGRLKLVVVLLVWHDHTALREPPTSEPVADGLYVEDRRHHELAGHRAILGQCRGWLDRNPNPRQPSAVRHNVESLLYGQPVCDVNCRARRSQPPFHTGELLQKRA